MSYVLKTREKKNSFTTPFRTVLAVALVLVIFYLFAPSALSSFFVYIARPFWNIEEKVDSGGMLVDVEELIIENEGLKIELAQKEGIYLQTDFIIKENEELKKLLGREDSSSLILAKVLKRPPFSPYDIFVLDIGSVDGIKAGDRVYAVGSIVIGEILEAGKETSKAKLYSSSGEKHNVFLGENAIEAVAYGKGGGVFEVSVPRDTKIKKGDSVTIPSLNDNFLAVVEDIISDPSHPFSTVLFAQPVNIYELKWVQVKKEI